MPNPIPTPQSRRRPGDTEYIRAAELREQAYALLREADTLTQIAYSLWFQIEVEKLKCSSTVHSASPSA